MNVDFEREKAWWNSKAEREETDLHDEPINRALRWREIERRLDGVRTILEVGGGTGAFSIPLARRGFEVTHVDHAPTMLERARERAAGLDDIRFVEANAADLSRFSDAQFDLVLNMDGAISFCGSEAERALRESCRVTKGTLVATVTQQAWMVANFVEAGITATGGIHPAAHDMMNDGLWHTEAHPDNVKLVPGYLGTFRAFVPRDVQAIVEDCGLEIARLSGLGSLAVLVHALNREAIRKVLDDQKLQEGFLNLCERFDIEFMPDGPGTYRRAGLIVVAKRGE